MSESDLSAIYLEIHDQFMALVDGTAIEAAALLTLKKQAAVGAALSIVITDDHEVHKLNKTFLGIDKPTDVLSFPSGDIDPDTGEMNLGDVIIAYPEAEKQAAAGNHPVGHELILLVVHGILHLLGFDHGEDDEKKAMWAVQADILTQLDVNIFPP